MDEDPIETAGPIDYLVVEFPANSAPDGKALAILDGLAANGTIRILDLAFFGRGDDGTVQRLEVTGLGIDGDVDASLLAEAASGLLDAEDLAEAAAVIDPGCVAAVLVYENTWAAPFAVALRRTGAQFVASGRIPVQAVLATLDALDADS
jgi:hypothetical protein